MLIFDSEVLRPACRTRDVRSAQLVTLVAGPFEYELYHVIIHTGGVWMDAVGIILGHNLGGPPAQ